MINTILPNGNAFDDGSGIDITTFTYLRNIARFPAFSINNKFDVISHSYLCAMLVNRYCDFMAKNLDGGKYSDTYSNVQFRYMLMQAVLLHDIEEVVINDIPAPVKIEGLDKIKKDIRKPFFDFVGFQHDEDLNSLNIGVKHIDTVAVLIECVIYLKNNSDDVLLDLIGYYLGKLKNLNILEFVEDIVVLPKRIQEMYYDIRTKR